MTESVFASGGYNTSPEHSSYLASSPYGLVTKDYHQSIAISQANGILVQSQTNIVSGASTLSKKTATCVDRWAHTLEPLHIQVPPLQALSSLSLKTEGLSCERSRSNKFNGLTPHSITYNHHHQLPVNVDCNNTSGFVSTMTSSPSTTCLSSSNDISNGCSRTIPISWSASSGSSSSTVPSSTSTFLGGSTAEISSPYSEIQTSQQHHAAASSSSLSTSSSVTLLQIKREPCQVSEVTTSNNIGHQHHNSHKSTSALASVVKIESSSPKSTIMDNQAMSAPQNSGAIPVGIAFARQRLQEQTTVAHQPKDSNRFGIGIADMGGSTSSLSSQNMFFTGTNSAMIPLTSEALSMGAPNVQSAIRTPPTFWQYPTPIPIESMLPMPIPPVGFQLVRDPNTGQFLFLPATTATIEPFQPAVVWPTYPQSATAIQSPHLLLPPIAQSLHPPPLAPLQLLGSDYLATASTTLHQHTQTHSTRFVALTADTKRKQVSGSAIPLPIPHHAVIKIEDCGNSAINASGATSTHHHQSMYSEEKGGSSIHSTAATITTAVQTNDVGTSIPTQLYYHQPSSGLIQIAPHHSQNSELQECRSAASNVTPPPLMVPPSLPTSSPKITTCLQSPASERICENFEATNSSCAPEVQDATIQTDTPVMSEDDNTVGADDCPLELSLESRDEVIHSTSYIQPPSSSSPLCHNNVKMLSELEGHMQKQIEEYSKKNDSGFDSNAVSSTNSLEEPASMRVEQWSNNNTTIATDTEEINTPSASSVTAYRDVQDFREISKVTSTPVDLSGLELLSNISIEAIEKKVALIKQEPVEDRKPSQLANASPLRENVQMEESKSIDMGSDKFDNQHEQLGGLNLLCALAEQRIQEEVGQRHRKRSSSSSDSYGIKKKKHKHSKSSKKSRHDKERREKKRVRKETEGDCKEKDCSQEGLDEDIKETFKRVKAKYTKCTTCNDGTLHCCKEKCGWPTPEELIQAMERDMRLRLADITRQCQEKKKELEEMSPKLQQCKQQQFSEDEESVPASCKSPIGSPHVEEPHASTLFSCSSPVEDDSERRLEDMKSTSDTECCDKFEATEAGCSSKRKGGNPQKHEDDASTEMIVAKKPKSIVGYILASKKRNSTETVKEKGTEDSLDINADDSTQSSELPCETPVMDAVKLEPGIAEEEETSTENIKSEQEQIILTVAGNTISSEKKYHHKSSKHHSKRKKSKSSKERKVKEAEKRKQKIDSSCVLTLEHLDKGKTRVLTAMAGLFYAGTLSPVQPPDIYAVTLDGERNNKPHIMSREEVLRDAILEISPASIEEILPGTRICAYWSQQYRCLYPGTVAVPSTPDEINDKKFVCVEFDDGDSGKIAIEDIRFLLSDYPIVEYDPNPLLSLGKRKRRTSQNNVENQKSENAPSGTLNFLNLMEENNVETDDYKERKKLKKLKKDRHKKFEAKDGGDGSASERQHKRKHKCSEDFCKHKKHKKRKKHKKHHHRESYQRTDSSQDADFCQNTPTPTVDVNDVSMNEEASQESKDDQEAFDPDIKEDTMMEEEVASSTTESSGSVYEPEKKKERQNSADNHSKIAAFLPARQLWAWAGKGHKRSTKGRVRKEFHRSIHRGKEIITVGDSAVFLSTGRPDRPYIGKIESLWETSSSNKVVRVKWFYHPEETIGCPTLKYPGALFESPHADENDVQTISHKCEVLPLEGYTNKFGPDLKQYENIYDNNDTYYLAGHYDPTMQTLKLQPGIPTLSEEDIWT